MTHATITSEPGDLGVATREGDVVGLHSLGHWRRRDLAGLGYRVGFGPICDTAP